MTWSAPCSFLKIDLFFFFYQQTGDEPLMDSPITVLSVETLTRMFADCSELLTRAMWCVFGNGQEFTIIYSIYSPIINNNFRKLPSYMHIEWNPLQKTTFLQAFKTHLAYYTNSPSRGLQRPCFRSPFVISAGRWREGTGETDESTSSRRRRRGNYWWRRLERRPLCRWFDPTDAWRPY